MTMTSNKTVIQADCILGGARVSGSGRLDVHNPWDGSLVGQVTTLDADAIDDVLAATHAPAPALTRHERSEILARARGLVEDHADELAHLILSEAGLCLRETRYEVGRTLDVLHFASMEALRDDGQAFSCDLTQSGKARRIFTVREPLSRALAITPFNHPLNQVAHKLAPAIAAGVPVVLKPSEKTPLTALRFAELLYEAGLPTCMLSVVIGDVAGFVQPLIAHPGFESVSFTGSAEIGKQIARRAGYKKLCLELGGNSPLIVLADADLELAVQLAAEGAFRNSGQRCTAVKRILVAEEILEPFTKALVEKAREYPCGDPKDEETRVGTVIDEEAARRLESRVAAARAAGARVLLGGARRGAVMEPTVIGDVPRDAEMVVQESFGPLAPIIAVRDLEDAIRVANSTAFGLSSGIVTSSLDSALAAVKGIRTGTVNVNEVPGYRIESSPFGGVKDSGLGVKEGVIEAMRFLTTVKTFSLPW